MTGMPVGYLVAVALVALGTLFAVVPLRRPSTLGGMSFLLGPFVNELPFVALYWLVISTLFALTEGDLDTPVGWAAFGVAILVTVGLGVVVRRGLRAGPAVERALANGLGSGWRDDVDSEPGARLRRHLPLARILLGAFFVRSRNVKRTANLSYGDAGKANLLDIYRHRSMPSDAPVLIHLHGGHFARGSKDREARALLYRLASQGWVCISANYRLSPAARFPDHLVDAKKVIAWAREHGPEYGADPTRVFVAGSSAGAHLAAMAALTAGDPAFQPGFEDVDTSALAAICLYGYYGTMTAGMTSSPLAHIGPDVPPFFLAHGDSDTTAPVEGARAFVDRLSSMSRNPVIYAELPGGQHTFDLFHSIRFESVINGIEAFTTWVMAQDDPGSPGRHRSAVIAADRRFLDC
jgi:acetyl esterase/lipase